MELVENFRSSIGVLAEEAVDLGGVVAEGDLHDAPQEVLEGEGAGFAEDGLDEGRGGDDVGLQRAHAGAKEGFGEGEFSEGWYISLVSATIGDI